MSESTVEQTSQPKDSESATSQLAPPLPEHVTKIDKVTTKLSTLPPELLEKIFEYLPATDVLRIAPTTKAFLNLGSTAAPDHKHTDRSKADDVRINLDVGSRKQLLALIGETRDLTELPAKILLAADEKTTPFQKQLQRITYMEILSGKISLKQAVEQISRFESSLTTDKNLPLIKAWSSGLTHWQKTAFSRGRLPWWLSLSYYPHDPTVGGFFSTAEMSSAAYTLLHAEVARSLKNDNPYKLSISLDNVKTSSVAALVAALPTSMLLLVHRFFTAIDRDDCVIAQAMLDRNPQLSFILPDLPAVVAIGEEEEDDEPEGPPLASSIISAIFRNAIATVRLTLDLLTAEQCQTLILDPLDDQGQSLLSMTIMQGNSLMAYILLEELSHAAPLTSQSEGWDQARDALYIAANQGNIEVVRRLLTVLDATERSAAISDPYQGSGLYAGQSALSIAETSGHTALVAMMKGYLPAPKAETEVALTASSSQPSPVRFFTAPASAPATEPRPSGSLAQHL